MQFFERILSAEALDVARAERPPLAIVDYYMPGGNGDELTAALLAGPETRDILVAMHSQRDVVEESLAAGAIDLIYKDDPQDVFLLRVAAMSRYVEAQSRQREVEHELRHMQKMESLGTLAGGIAHEINTPIQYVAENLRFLSDSFSAVVRVLEKFEGLVKAASATGVLATPATYVNAVAVLEHLRGEIPNSINQSIEGIERISEIVRAIKEFSHRDAKTKSAIDINHAIETAITVARNQWKYVPEIETDFDQSLPAVPCLPGEFSQVMLNLIVNAAHAIEETGAKKKGRITVSTRNDGDRVEIRVSDTGVGIPEEMREKIFDPFFTTKDPGKGTGQGLAICYTIITKKYNGTISVQSEMGKGATFIVYLPIAVEDASDAAA
ncbi:MAG: ATP-binding protein [Alphaproteobacteria bacterium]